MAVSLVYMPILTFTDQNSNPLPFAKVFSFAATTTTPLSLFANSSGSTPLPNPAITDAAGKLVAYATVGVAYKLDLFDQNNVHVPGWPIDSIVVTANGDPTLIAGYANVAEMRLTLDPGEVGTEVVPTSLRQWQQEVQFCLRERGRVNQWYESYTNCTVQNLEIVLTSVPTTTFPVMLLHNLQLMLSLATDIANLFPPTGLTTQYHTFRLPLNWQAQSDLTFVFDRKTTSGAGTAMMNYAVNRERSGQAVANIVTTTAINFAPGNANMQRFTVTIPGVALLAGDRIVVTLQRDGDHASDTDAGNILILGSDVSYTAVVVVPPLDTLNFFPPTGLTTQYHTFQLPDGWRPQSDLVWVFDRRSTSGVGTAMMNYAVNRERSGQTAANIVTTTPINFAPGNANLQRVSATIPGSGLLQGDRVVITLQRDGDNASDTDAGNILVLGNDVVYTGLAGT